MRSRDGMWGAKVRHPARTKCLNPNGFVFSAFLPAFLAAFLLPFLLERMPGKGTSALAAAVRRSSMVLVLPSLPPARPRFMDGPPAPRPALPCHRSPYLVTSEHSIG